MKETLHRIGLNLQSFFRDKINTVIFLLLINIGLVLYVYLEGCDERYHYYMNNKSSLEAIHRVKIDRYNGKLEKELTTEEELARKNNRRFHLKYVFK